MQLINALTNAKYLTVDMRMHIRNEMMAAGMHSASSPSFCQIAHMDLCVGMGDDAAS